MQSAFHLTFVDIDMIQYIVEIFIDVKIILYENFDEIVQ